MEKLNITNLAALLVALKKTIEDEFRASDVHSEDDDFPSMLVTVAWDQYTTA